ncbi:MAG TPA: putative 2-aminoethylphosphonate ABC transporter ATP-binding protein [Hyphomicrobiaceae bacterium]|jgi:iron(III) transport system ATP-binding protein|nr:putative 2-aminoethylphosphonate ABC transporter ATP-binding protein [Hyphomicrobiaceae bacterium]
MMQSVERTAAVASSQIAAGGAVRPPHLRIEAISKRFGAFSALEDVSLAVEAGRLVCFLGPSGCGKTTLLRVIAGLEVQDAGRIEIGGRDVSRLPPAQRDFGIVFQSYALFPNLTVAQNIGYGLVNRRKGRAAIKARVAEMLSLVGLSEHGAKYPIQLSGGQQQRVALARALASSPTLLLLDEPLSALDARVRVRLREEIKALQQSLGVTTIMVTHDQEEALAMADSIVVMNRGRVEQIGAPPQIYGHPATAFVADFVGEMNMFDATIAAADRLAVGDLILTSTHIGNRGAGTQVRLGLRPEEVRIRGLEPGQPNTLTVTVTVLDFLGAFWRATLRLEADERVFLRSDFSINAMRDLDIRLGQRLRIALPAEALRVFDGARP